MAVLKRPQKTSEIPKKPKYSVVVEDILITAPGDGSMRYPNLVKFTVYDATENLKELCICEAKFTDATPSGVIRAIEHHITDVDNQRIELLRELAGIHEVE
jgi:hypothetical protein